MKATDEQVGGSHYQMAIQPIEFIVKNGIDFCEGNAIKYICRHEKKMEFKILIRPFTTCSY